MHENKALKQIGIEREPSIDDYLIFGQLKIDQEFFLKIFVKNLKTLNKFTHFDQDIQHFLNHSEKISIFDSQAFLESWEENRREFLKSMFETQIFSGFIDKAFKLHNNGLLEHREQDTEKIKYFFKSISYLDETSPKELRKVMDVHMKQALKCYYMRTEKSAFSNYRDSYYASFMSKFTGRIDPMNYLIKETVIHGDRQLSLVEGINDKLIIKDWPRPFTQQNKHHYEIKWESRHHKDTLQNAPNKLSRSKSSHAFKLDSEIEEASPVTAPITNLSEKPTRSGAEKREAFKSKKLAQTHYYPSSFPSEDHLDEQRLISEKQLSLTKLPSGSPPWLSRALKSKSFRGKNFTLGKTHIAFPKSDNTSLIGGVETSTNSKYRKNRNPIFNTSKLFTSTSKGQNKKRSYRTKDMSSSNVSKNMIKFNNELEANSKKFMQGIDSDYTNYEIVDKRQLEERWRRAGELDGRIESSAKKKPPKPKLKRGMTVKFQEDEDILQRVERNNELVRKFCKTKSFKKRSKTKTNYDKLTKRYIISLFCSKEKHQLKTMKKPKYNIEATKRWKSKSFKENKYFSQNWTPNPKEGVKNESHDVFEEFSMGMPLRLKTDWGVDLKKTMLTERKSSNETKEIKIAPSLKNKASFVAIEAKPDPTEDGKMTMSSSTILNEGSLSHLHQLKSKEHQLYSEKENNQKKTINQINCKEDLLKRSKSYANEEDYDTVIIEEEFFSPNKRKKLPRNIFPKKSMLMKSLSVNTTDWNSDQANLLDQETKSSFKWSKEIEIQKVSVKPVTQRELLPSREKQMNSFHQQNVSRKNLRLDRSEDDMSESKCNYFYEHTLEV